MSAVGELEEAFAREQRSHGRASRALFAALWRAPERLAGLALRHKLPTVTLSPDFARAGGLIA